MNEERKREILKRRKDLYECNKELLEIDPNLIILIKLKRSDYFTLVTFGTIIAYKLLFKNTNKTKKFFGFFALWLIVEWNIASYYSNVYPYILLKNTKELMEMKKALGEDQTI